MRGMPYLIILRGSLRGKWKDESCVKRMCEIVQRAMKEDHIYKVQERILENSERYN